jgi:DNA-binding XRE family transcriptional regulator
VRWPLTSEGRFRIVVEAVSTAQNSETHFGAHLVNIMDIETRVCLEAAGFVETNIEELFGLTPEENELVETRVALSRLIKQLRLEAHVSQATVAKRIGSDQARIARAEKNDPSISIELMLRTAFALGAKRQQIAQALCS